MTTPSEATPRDAFAAISDGGALLIDVREQWEYDEMRIPGALLIPLGDLPARIAEVPDDRDVYVHCRMGARSARAVEFLRSHGRPRSTNVTGGIEQWADDGLPTEQENVADR